MYASFPTEGTRKVFVWVVYHGDHIYAVEGPRCFFRHNLHRLYRMRSTSIPSGGVPRTSYLQFEQFIFPIRESQRAGPRRTARSAGASLSSPLRSHKSVSVYVHLTSNRLATIRVELRAKMEMNDRRQVSSEEFVRGMGMSGGQMQRSVLLLHYFYLICFSYAVTPAQIVPDDIAVVLRTALMRHPCQNRRC